MKITFEKKIEVTLEFDVEAVAEYIVETYKREYGSDDPNCEFIYDDVDDNIYNYLEFFGLSEEDEDAIIDSNIEGYDILGDFTKSVQNYIEAKYKF